MRISLVFLISLSFSITLGKDYFSCRRQGQDCANNKTCQNDGTCDCGNDYTGYNCELQKSLSGSSPCANQTDSCGSDGGICYNDNGNKACFCPFGFYGDQCENKRYDVTCEKSSMLIVINPAGTFSGVVYAKGEKDTPGCKFSPSDVPSGKQGVGLSVKDSDCGGVMQVSRGRSRDVVIQYSEKYMTNLDTIVTVTCTSDDAKTVTVTKVITSEELDRNTDKITDKFDSIDSSVVQFNINLKDGSSVSESEAVSLNEELAYDFFTNLTAEVLDKIADIEPVNVRLSDGNTTKEGRVEVFFNGKWGRLHTDYFYFFEATAICRNLGFNNAFGMPRGKGFCPAGSGQVWEGDLSCNGFELDVDKCPSWKIKDCGDTCSGEDIGIICDENPIPYRLQLNEIGAERKGKLQVHDDGEWNYVCHTQSFHSEEAGVVCRQLGYAKAKFYGGSGNVTDKRWKYNIDCDEYEPALHLCVLSTRDERSACPFVEISCSDPISNIEIRLVGGPNSNYGTVEVKLNNEWGRLYISSPSVADARVMCRTLGFNESYKAILLSRYEHNLTSSHNKIIISNVMCTGLEKKIDECYLRILKNINHNSHIALICAEDNREVEIRLVGSNSTREGRVEIKYLGMWGTVCDKYHTDYNAAVYCRMLGFTHSNATAVGSAYFGEGSGPIFLRDVHCLGNETSLEQCDFHWGNYRCDHRDDAGVICAEPESGTLRVESCTADNQKTGEDSETFKIIENSCPSSEIGKLMIQEPERSGNKVTFKLKAFTFNKNNKVSTECSVKVCPPDQTALCDPVDCNGKEGFGRKRRSAETSDERVRKTYTVLDVMNGDQISSEKQGSDQVSINNMILIVLCVVMVIIFSLVIGIVVVVFLRKKKSNQKKEDFSKRYI